MDNSKAGFLLKTAFLLLSFLLTLYFGFQRIEKDNTVNGAVIFSMEELGYKESNPIGSFAFCWWCGCFASRVISKV